MPALPNIARLHIALDGSEPLVWRRIEIALSASLLDLHEAIQAVMPWSDCHLFAFTIGEDRYGLRDPELELDEDDFLDAESKSLGAIISAGVRNFSYLYDFGDDWEHEITVEAELEAKPRTLYPRLVDGARAAPPEDVGGLDGYYDLLHTLREGSAEDKAEALEWLEGDFDPEAIDHERINEALEDIAAPVKSGGKKG